MIAIPFVAMLAEPARPGLKLKSGLQASDTASSRPLPDLAIQALLIAFPGVALWLPEAIGW